MQPRAAETPTISDNFSYDFAGAAGAAVAGAAAAGALAAGAAAGALSPEPPLDPAAGAAAGAAPSLADSPPAAAGGFTEPYPSLYHPPPAKWTAGAVMVRSSTPPQCGQTVISGSENF